MPVLTHTESLVVPFPSANNLFPFFPGAKIGVPVLFTYLLSSSDLSEELFPERNNVSPDEQTRRDPDLAILFLHFPRPTLKCPGWKKLPFYPFSRDAP